MDAATRSKKPIQQTPSVRSEPTRLGRAIAGTDETQPSRLAQAASGARVLHRFTIPRLGIPAVMTLCPHSRKQQIEGAVYATMAGLKLPLDRVTEWTYEADRASRTLAEVVLDPTEVQAGRFTPIGSLDDWQNLDEQIIEDCWRTYLDVVAANDPVAIELTPDEIQFVDEMISKKNGMGLRYFGTRRLSAYLLATGEPRSTSAIPRSTRSLDSTTSSTPSKNDESNDAPQGSGSLT